MFFLSSLAMVLNASAQQSGEGAWLTLHGKKVLFYQIKTKSHDGQFPRADYVHPLYGPDGFELTEDFPKDHLHHRGIFWTWHQVLIGDEEVSDAWVCKDFIWNVKDVNIGNEEGKATLHAKTFWESRRWTDENGKLKPFVEERVEITAQQPADDYRLFDFSISLRALEKNVKIGGSDNAKGYGGFSVRMKMPDDIRFASADGEVAPQATAVKAGPWMNISGSLAENSKGGVVIMCHPENPGYPEPWILRKKGSMQNPAWPGREPVLLPTDKPVVLKYRLVVYVGEMRNKDIKTIFNQYKQIK